MVYNLRSRIPNLGIKQTDLAGSVKEDVLHCYSVEHGMSFQFQYLPNVRGMSSLPWDLNFAIQKPGTVCELKISHNAWHFHCPKAIQRKHSYQTMREDRHPRKKTSFLCLPFQTWGSFFRPRCFSPMNASIADYQGTKFGHIRIKSTPCLLCLTRRRTCLNPKNVWDLHVI